MDGARVSSESHPLAVPTLDDLARDPSRAAALSPDVARTLWVRGHVALGALAPLVAVPVAQQPPNRAAAEADRYLTMKEVRQRTGLSLSHLYEMGRTGVLPVRQMGNGTRGTKRRGYRILLSDLLDWEARRATGDVDVKISNMLSSHRDGQGVSAASKAPRLDAGPTRRPARRASNNGLPMGTGPGRPDSTTRRQADSVTEAGPQA
jgi:hypothetical protein